MVKTKIWKQQKQQDIWAYWQDFHGSWTKLKCIELKPLSVTADFSVRKSGCSPREECFATRTAPLIKRKKILFACVVVALSELFLSKEFFPRNSSLITVGSFYVRWMCVARRTSVFRSIGNTSTQATTQCRVDVVVSGTNRDRSRASLAF